MTDHQGEELRGPREEADDPWSFEQLLQEAMRDLGIVEGTDARPSSAAVEQEPRGLMGNQAGLRQERNREEDR